jgi:hypothetical protein
MIRMIRDRSNHHRNVGTVSSPPQIGSMEKKSDGYSSKLERGLSLNITVTLRQGLLCTRTPVLLSSGVMQTKYILVYLGFRGRKLSTQLAVSKGVPGSLIFSNVESGVLAWSILCCTF